MNLTKREYIHPHRLGSGLKLGEQVGTFPGTGAALLILCAAMPEPRGGGDLSLGEDDPEYAEVAKRTIGRWAGDRIALVGDYAERTDLPEADNADLIFPLCNEAADVEAQAAHLEQRCERPDDAARLRMLAPFVDVSADVARVIERECGGHFEGDGWREFAAPGRPSQRAMRPDTVLMVAPRE